MDLRLEDWDIYKVFEYVWLLLNFDFVWDYGIVDVISLGRNF